MRLLRAPGAGAAWVRSQGTARSNQSEASSLPSSVSLPLFHTTSESDLRSKTSQVRASRCLIRADLRKATPLSLQPRAVEDDVQKLQERVRREVRSREMSEDKVSPGPIPVLCCVPFQKGRILLLASVVRCFPQSEDLGLNRSSQ